MRDHSVAGCASIFFGAGCKFSPNCRLQPNCALTPMCFPQSHHAERTVLASHSLTDRLYRQADCAPVWRRRRTKTDRHRTGIHPVRDNRPGMLRCLQPLGTQRACGIPTHQTTFYAGVSTVLRIRNPESCTSFRRPAPRFTLELSAATVQVLAVTHSTTGKGGTLEHAPSRRACSSPPQLQSWANGFARVRFHVQIGVRRASLAA